MGKEAKDKSADGSRRFLRYTLILVLAGTALFCALALVTFSPSDPPAGTVYPPPPTHNFGGPVGAHIAYALMYWIGDGVKMLLLFLVIAAFMLLTGGVIRDLPWRITGLVLMVTATSSAVYLASPISSDGLIYGNGGMLGIGVGRFLSDYFGPAAWLVLLVTFGASVLLTSDALVFRLPAIGRSLWQRSSGLRAALPGLRRGVQPAPALERPGRGKVAPVDDDDDEPTARPKPAKGKAESVAADDQADGQDAEAPKSRVEKDAAKAKDASSANDVDQAPAPAPAAPAKPAALVARPKVLPKIPPRPKAKPGEYQLPSAELLAEPTGGFLESQEVVAQERSGVLQQTLNDFAVQAEVVGHMTGPVITQFELSLDPGVKVSEISGLATDIARSLAVSGVRVVSPLPGKDTVGIEVPNRQKEIVRLKELMALAPDAADKMQLPLYLGKDAAGGAIVADLASMPHLLMAGTTGSGKSVCINAVITSLLLTRTPQQVKFILIDPKMVEMAAYEKIPHLLCPIVNDMRRVEDVLEWAAMKMDERYEVLKEAGVRNIIGFNRLKPEEIHQRFGAETDEEKAHVITHMPYYVIIVDELADLIMTASKEVEGHIIRIAQKARAVGIHLIVATQRPSVNVVTGLIKSNMPCRVSFRVASRQESRIVLDQNGAEVLLGQGDMLFLQPGTSQIMRAQGTYVDDNEIRSLVVSASQQVPDVEYNDELMKLQSGCGELGEGEKDELFDQAVEIILAAQRGSVSLLQRRLQVGYSRASRIVDQMAEAGLLGDYKGSQARECLMTLEDWQILKASIQADRTGQSAANGEPTSA
jgi:S-DNA-T family DNA segregation ATPase FtsK/SpoIIIE